MADVVSILLDTDIGSDIDDAVALAYLLRQPRCRLLGITTVTGDVAQRADCAAVLCNAMNRADIPIHPGASLPLLFGRGQPEVPHHAAIRELVTPVVRPANSAVEFMRQTIRRHPGEVTLLSIGPLTNIALLFALDPEVPSLLKQFVSMAGVFFPAPAAQRPTEWNIRVDPLAAWLVYNRNWNTLRPHLSVGLDVTTQCVLDAAVVRERFTTPPLNLVRQMAEVWFSHSREVTFHDPLAAALIFEPELCKTLVGRVTVPQNTDADYGATLFEPNPRGPHAVASQVDAERFFAHYFSICAGGRAAAR